MKKAFFIAAVILGFIHMNVTAQVVIVNNRQEEVPSADSSGSEKRIYTKVEEMPGFAGGDAMLFGFIETNIKYPSEAKEKKIAGRVFATFVIDEAGKIHDPKILRGLGYGCDEEVLRVIGLMPDWIPGKQDGKTVSVQYNLPVSFNLR